jgi:hypothetical protein
VYQYFVEIRNNDSIPLLITLEPYGNDVRCDIGDVVRFGFESESLRTVEVASADGCTEIVAPSNSRSLGVWLNEELVA